MKRVKRVQCALEILFEHTHTSLSVRVIGYAWNMHIIFSINVFFFSNKVYDEYMMYAQCSRVHKLPADEYDTRINVTLCNKHAVDFT